MKSAALKSQNKSSNKIHNVNKLDFMKQNNALRSVTLQNKP